MATGSITSLGLGSGLDLQDILDQLKEVESVPIETKEAEKVELQQTINAFNSVNATLFSMKSSALSLSLESDFLKTTATVSDEDLITARADDGVSESSTTIEITQKARANSFSSTGVSSESTAILAEPATSITDSTEAVTSTASVMTIQYGPKEDMQDIDIDLTSGMSLDDIADAINDSGNNANENGTQLVTATVEQNTDGNYYIRLQATNGGNSADSQILVSGDYDYVQGDTTISIAKKNDSDQIAFISIPPGTTFSEIADLINESDDNPGVIAAVIDDGSDETPYKLTITAKSTGEENRFEISENFPMTEVTGAEEDSLNALFTVNGVSYQRQSNDGIDDVIAGVKLNLKKTGETTVSIQNDLESAKENILDFVENFNKLLTQVNGSDTTDDESSESDSALEDSYTAKKIISDLYSLIGSVVDTGGEYSSLYDIGLELNDDGTLSIDEDTLDQAIAANPDDIKSLFLGNEDKDIKGLGDIINDGITAMIDSSGTITTALDEAEEKMERLDEDIATATERLEAKYELMAAEFTRLDTYINSLNNEASLLTSMIESYNNMTSSD